MTAPDQTNSEVSDERLRDDSADEVGWLIERNDLEVKPLWYWEDPYKPGWHSWTRTAADAKRFPTRAEAEAFEPYRLIATDKAISLTEHVFIGTAVARNSDLNRRSATQASEGAQIWERCAGMAHHYAELCEEAGKGDAAEELYVLEHDIRHEASKAAAVSKRVERLETGWQTIETAPKPADKWSLDRVLVAFGPEDGNRVDIAYWVGSDDVPYWRSSLMEQVHGKRYMRQHQPTHWRPLIAPPQALGGRS